MFLNTQELKILTFPEWGWSFLFIVGVNLFFIREVNVMLILCKGKIHCHIAIDAKDEKGWQKEISFFINFENISRRSAIAQHMKFSLWG